MSTIILGAGPIGIATAYEFAKRGEQVCVISKRKNVGEAGHVNAGWVVPIMSAPVPAPGALKKSIRWLLDSQSPLKITAELNWEHIAFMVEMLRYSTQKNFLHGLHSLSEFGRGTLAAFDEYALNGVKFELHRTGVLMAFTSQAELDSHAIEYEGVEKYGLAPVKVLSGKQMREREPMLTDLVTQGIDCSDQYFVEPTTFINGLRSKAQELGVKFIESDSEVRLTSSGGEIAIEISTEKHKARNVVIAAGVESRNLLEGIGVRIPLRFGKGYSFDFQEESRIRNSLYLSGTKIAVTPNEKFLRFAGTMEFGGDGMKINHKRALGILANSAKYFSFQLPQSVAPRVGLRPMTPDGLPVIGKIDGVSNLYIASGHAMQGVTLAPNTAKATADLVLHKESKIDISAFSPMRFR